MARCVFAEEHASFRRKRGSKKWQGGHFLRALRGSACAPLLAQRVPRPSNPA